MLKFYYQLLLLITLGLNLGCLKPVEESDVQSLDNYVAADGSKLIRNQCNGPYENKEFSDLEFIDAPEHLRPVVLRTLSAIPLSLRELFATKLVGKITVSADAKTLCNAAKKSLDESRLDTEGLDTTSCLKAQAGSPGVELVLTANESSIKHGLVRAFFSAVFTTMAESTYDEKLKLFVAAAKDVDLIKIEKAVQASLKLDLAGKTSINAKLFADPVDAVIEAADMYYCSKTTRAKLRSKEFENTYSAFKNNFVSIIHESGEKNPEELYNEILASNSKVSNSSLALWGRRGAGYGPMRAWGRSRMAARQAGGVGLYPNWNLARQQGYAAGGRGVYPNWQLSRQNARQQLRASGYPGTSLFPNYWANRYVR